MRLSLLCLTIFVGLTACTKEKLDINSFWQCHQSQSPDTTTISTKLIGSWTWYKQSCFWTGNTIRANKKIIVTFQSNRTFSVNENGTILTQGTWMLTKVDDNSWGLDLSSVSDYLYGRILFCDKQVLFNDSYRDGCDNLFNKNN